jgi:hypothetical protein
MRSPWLLVAALGLAGCASNIEGTPPGSGDSTGAPVAAVTAAAEEAGTTEPAPPWEGPWLLTEGTTTLGFGILRLAPPAGESTGTFRIRFEDYGDGGYSSDASSACLIVLPGDVFETSDAAWADSWLGFHAVPTPKLVEAGEAKYYPLAITAETTVTVDRERTVLVAYGPWDGADVGRPPSNEHTFTLTVTAENGGNYRWVESEAGEMVTTNWTHRPGVARGRPWTEADSGEKLWMETRILVLYDPVNAGPAGVDDPDDPRGDRLRLRPELFETLAKVPIRWR